MRPLIVIGTRPEAIKLAPVARALPEARVALSGQHDASIIRPILDYFGIGRRRTAAQRVHIAGYGLAQSFAAAVEWITPIAAKASCVIVQGDTTTATAGALAGFYAGVPVVHVEAGLRTYDSVPYPEEANRRMISAVAAVHCCPTEQAAENLRRERVQGRIEVTGNTVVDAIQWTLERDATPSSYDVLVTCHRRESQGRAAEMIAEAVDMLAWTYPDVRFAWSLHPNPNAKPHVLRRVECIPPPDYPRWVRMMATADLILTDSGGIQEEAAILGKPCLVLRDSSERPEAVECGACRIVGTDPDRIVAEASRVLDGESWPISPHPFGDGHSGERIAKIVRELTNCQLEEHEQCQSITTRS